MTTSSSTFQDSKKHLLILDGLRGVAALMVLVMHAFEIFCGGDYHKMFVNHGYLAVDFFFMLSGYVMAHAYDDRWDQMTVWDFCKRRLIRLHPMIIIVAIFFWGSALNGIAGMILAIPLTAFFVVFWRLAREKYIHELV